MNLAISILQKELTSLQEALDASRACYKKGMISAELHSVHMGNIVPKIDTLREAIKILKHYDNTK